MGDRSHGDAVRAAEQALHNQYNLLPRRQLFVCMVTLSLTMLVSFIDQNGISITLPTIAKDLDATDTISWAGTTSLVANTTFQMLYGRLSDVFGRKSVFLAAIGCLSLADLLCGLAQNATMLYVFRGLAGIGSGGITNLALIILSDVVTLEKRGKYFGILAAMIGLGNVLGPFLAAAFVWRTTWRAFFWMLAPLGALTGVLAYFYLPDKPPTVGFKESVMKIDFAGTIASSLGIIFLLIPISGGGAYFAWNSPMIISMLVIGVMSLIAFLIIEWKVAKLPIMPLNIFANTAVTVSLIQTFLFGAVHQASIYYIPLYLLNARGLGEIPSASIIMALALSQSVFSVLSGQYISHFKRYGEVIITGFALWTLGVGLFLTYTRTTSPGFIVAPLIVAGAGGGTVFQPTLQAMQAHSPKARRAVIISNRNFFRCLGGAVGLAASAAVLQAALRGSLPPGRDELAGSTYALPSDLGSGPEAEAVRDAYMTASRAVFIMWVPMMGLGLLGCAFIRDRGLQPPEDEEKKDGTSQSEQMTTGENADPERNAQGEKGVLSTRS